MSRPVACALAGVALSACMMLPANLSAQQTEPPQGDSNSFWAAFTGGQFKGLLRYSTQYRNSNLQSLQDGSDPAPPDQVDVKQYSAIGGFVGYQTADWFGFSAGATIYTSQAIGNNPDSRRGLGGLYEADGGQDPYTALGEFYLGYRRPGHWLTLGRREMPAYRMVSLSNIRMTPVTHSGAVYENTQLENTQVNIGWITQMKERNAKEFIDMARGARLTLESNGKQLIRGPFNPDYYNESGYIGPEKEMAMIGVLHKGDGFSLEGWNYHVRDFVNSLYLYADWSFAQSNDFVHTLAAQYTNQREVGDAIGGDIDTWHWGLSLRGSGRGMSWFASYNKTAYNEQSYDGGTLFVRWGTPQMFMSFQVQDSELAGTESYGAGFQYDFGHKGRLPGFVMRWRYGVYDMPDDLSFTDARQDRAEATFDLRYSFSRDSGFGIFTEMQGLSVQFRLAYNNYNTDYDFEAYRAIHGYEFSTVTKDFFDARLYIDYIF